MNTEKPRYYAIIPSEVRYDKDLTPSEKLLYGEITALSSGKGYCWATNGYFASLYNVTPQSISRWIHNLKRKQYINVRNSNSRKRTINLNKNLNVTLTKTLNNLNNNVKHNNKSNSKNRINNNLDEIFEEVRMKNEF